MANPFFQSRNFKRDLYEGRALEKELYGRFPDRYLAETIVAGAGLDYNEVNTSGAPAECWCAILNYACRLLELESLFKSIENYLRPAPYDKAIRDLIQKIRDTDIPELEDEVGDDFETTYVPVLPREIFDESEILVGRREELSKFSLSLASLAGGSLLEGPRVLLIEGEGGMGKSSLLRQFARECRKVEQSVDWMYTDWEASGITSNGGTPLMMSYLASQLRSAFGINFTEFEEAHRKARELRTTDPDIAGEDHSGLAAPSSRRQLELSRALMKDLTTSSKQKPLILLFDTFEVVQDFASHWLREGLLRSFLLNRITRDRIILVVAGRFGDNDRLSYRDDVRRYFGTELAFFGKTLERLSRDEIRDCANDRYKYKISDEQVDLVFRHTSGFPLGVASLLNELSQGILNNNDLAKLGSGGSTSYVTAELSKRFLKHVPSDRSERRRLISFITIRSTEGVQVFDRLRMLRLLWDSLRAQDNSRPLNFDSELEALKSKYSFLLSNGLIRPEVWGYLQCWVVSSEFEPTLTMEVCNEAYRICGGEQQIREAQIKQTRGDSFDSERYTDGIWRNWTLDKIHYGLWLNNIDDSVDLIIDHYVSALMYGHRSFSDELMLMCSEDAAIYSRFETRHRKLLNELKSLRVGATDDELTSTRSQLRKYLRGKPKLAWHIQVAKKLARKRKYNNAAKQLSEAEVMLANDDYVGELSIRKELGKAFFLLGKLMSDSSAARSTQLDAKDFLEKSLSLVGCDAYLHCALGNAYLKLDWLDDAERNYKLASSAGMQRAQNGLDRVRDRAQIVGKNPAASKKIARLYTAQVATLCEEARFEEAMAKAQRAIELMPGYLPARVRRCHILRVLGDAGQARQELEQIDPDSIAELDLRSGFFEACGTTYHALERWTEAERAFLSAIQLKPTYMNAIYGLGRVHLSSQKYEEAVDRFEEVISIKRRLTRKKGLDPASLYWVYVGLGLAHTALCNNLDADTAFIVAEKLCDRDIGSRGGGRHYQLWANKIVALLGQRQYEKASEAITALTSISPLSRTHGIFRQVSEDVDLLYKFDRSEGLARAATAIALLQ
ncbi:AAA family ATPase (plasmid) [Rhizobium leguminosarum]